MKASTDEDGGLWVAAAAGLAAVGAVGFALWARSARGEQTHAESVAPGEDMTPREPIWPIPVAELLEIGDAVTEHRKGSGRPHRGVDLKAKQGTRVFSATTGRVLRVVRSDTAGLFVDVRGRDGKIYRYLHLHDDNSKPPTAAVVAAQAVKPGDLIGTVGAKGESGVFNSAPHLHFEIRQGDVGTRSVVRNGKVQKDYGEPVNPLSVLPLRLLPTSIRRLIA